MWTLRKDVLVLTLLAALAYPLFFHHIGERDLWSSHEARAAQNAQLMLDTGDWLLPKLYDGRIEMQKPPLFYWLVAGISRLRGGPVDAWSVRAPAAFAALGTMFLVYVLLRNLGRPVAGLIAAAMLGTMIHFTWMARVGRIDMPLTFACTGVLTGYLLGFRFPTTQPRLWLLLAYLSAAACFLLKGPVGLVLMGLVIAADWLIGPRSKSAEEDPPTSFLKRSGLCWGVPLVLAIVLPWFLWANEQTHGEFFRIFFVRHNLQRGWGGDADFEAHDHPFFFYFIRMMIDFLPWSILFPLVLFCPVSRGSWRHDLPRQFAALWFGVPLFVLTLLSYKRADYLLPAYPGMAILLACFVERALLSWTPRVTWSAFGGVVTAFSIGWIVYVDHYLPEREPAREQRSFAMRVREHVSHPNMVLLFRAEAHELIFHLGRPFDRLMEWENLDIWACQPTPVYVIMTLKYAAERREHLEAGKLYPLLIQDAAAGRDPDDRFVLLCTKPPHS